MLALGSVPGYSRRAENPHPAAARGHLAEEEEEEEKVEEEEEEEEEGHLASSQLLSPPWMSLWTFLQWPDHWSRRSSAEHRKVYIERGFTCSRVTVSTLMSNLMGACRVWGGAGGGGALPPARFKGSGREQGGARRPGEAFSTSTFSFCLLMWPTGTGRPLCIQSNSVSFS